MNRQFITGTSSGLKTVAPMVGHKWEVDDAGGAVSMVWYDLAVDGDPDGATMAVGLQPR